MTPNSQAELDQLCAAAFDSEYLHDKSLAIAQHQQATAGLQLLERSPSVDKQRKVMAKRQLKFHASRLQLLRTIQNNGQLRLLPTSKTARDQLGNAEQSNISLDQWRLTQFEQHRRTDPNAEMPDNIVHLMIQPIPLYTPTIPLVAPSVFDVHVSVEMNGLLGGHYFHVKAEDPATQQTLYVLKLLRPLRRQFTSAAFYRAAEFVKPAIVMNITPVDIYKLSNPRSPGLVGRNFIINNGLGIIEEKMDRQMKPDWNPKRFTYGGRHFVWRQGKDSFLGIGPGDLYETKRVWPKPGSKTGKMLDEIVPERLSWGHNKARFTSMCQISIKGGLDQFFVEYILASQMTKMIVSWRGYD